MGVMPVVKFYPGNLEIRIEPGDSILDAALAASIELNHNCGGYCACSTCHVIIEEGMDNLSPMENCEEDRLDEVADLTLRSRLGCQAKVFGNVTVRIPGA